ncbi:toxin (plasmid) [Aeromonas salmonicida subsp. salmonicida A449]|uniref:Toxin n=2 Tax=Aeromonas salmonicida subsp. salmonicida TaxID=29491 RepID=Q7X2E3_AERS4|nr:toxin [Aeromonas salmonicida subsp. salmonicida A449]KTA87003.1 RelE [Aeromonas salmonicida subsp. salmonicida]
MTWSAILAWKVELTDTAKKQLARLDKTQSQRITKYLRRIMMLENPRDAGKALTGNLRTYWRYRVGDYRVVCDIRDNDLVIVAVIIGHRSEVYGGS